MSEQSSLERWLLSMAAHYGDVKQTTEVKVLALLFKSKSSDVQLNDFIHVLLSNCAT